MTNENESEMLSATSGFNQDILNWVTVTTFELTFANTVIFNQDMSGWDESSVAIYRMVIQVYQFIQDILDCDISRVHDMQYIFIMPMSSIKNFSLEV